MNPQILERYRHTLGLNMTELAAKMGRTPGWYSRIKDGKQPLPVRYIEPMATLFGVSPQQLVQELFAAEELEDSSHSDRLEGSPSEDSL